MRRLYSVYAIMFTDQESFIGKRVMAQITDMTDGPSTTLLHLVCTHHSF